MRLRPLIEQWLGHHKPKQYCTFIGTRSMLQHTLDRADQLCTPEHKVTVIAREHLCEASALPVEGRAGKVILQPVNRDTAAAIFLALAHVRAHDPKATVVLYPSDHFVYPEDRFIGVVRCAVKAARQLKDHIILLGVPPDKVDLEYGWIQQGPHLGWIAGHRVRAVRKFIEKPSFDQANAAMANSALWNTLVLAAKVELLWAMGWRCFPGMMQLFEEYGKAIGTSEEEALLEAIYEMMPVWNFSFHLLQRTPGQIAVIELNDVLWSDWGKSERIVETLCRIGKCPAFPMSLAAAV